MKDFLLVFCLFISVRTATSLPQCEVLSSEVSTLDGAAKTRKLLKGLWVSQRCETWPGPQYVLRRYQFHQDLSFRLLRFYYSDPWCRVPAFLLSAAGRMDPLSSAAASWIVPGALEPSYSVRRITAIPFSEDKARILAQSVGRSCPAFSKKRWKLHKKYRILNYNERLGTRRPSGNRKELDCASALGYSFAELQLLRAEERPAGPGLPAAGRRNITLELHLGAELESGFARPTFFKPPLLHEKTEECSICRIVAKSTSGTPPRLTVVRHQDSSAQLTGRWLSTRCEVRPQGLFLKRRFTFAHAPNTWAGQHTYFRDHNCQKPMFVLKASGLYFKKTPSRLVPGAFDVDFEIKQAALTPKDEQFVSNLNGFHQVGGCGIGTKWRLDVPGNLTSSQGCEALGVIVPSVELDIVKVERQKHGLVHLYLGQDTDDNSRPTSFQPPLAQCESLRESNDVSNVLHPLAQVQLTNVGTQVMRSWTFLLAAMSHWVG